MATSVESGHWADLIGVPYRIKGRGPDEFDCYGLVAELWRRIYGVELPALDSPRGFEAMDAAAVEHRTHFQRIAAEPGAIALIRIGRHLSHVGLVLPGNRLIHCWSGSRGVVVERLDGWRHRIEGFYRYG